MTVSPDIRLTMQDSDRFAQQFQNDGVLLVEGAFTEDDMAIIEQAYQGNLDNPSPLLQQLYTKSGGTFIQSVEDSSAKPTFRKMFAETPVVDIAKCVFGDGGVWYFHEQLFFKDGAKASVRRTPWHQDTPYHPVDGSKFAVFWIPLQDVSAESALEVVRGSHRQTLYNGSFFDDKDDTLPIYDEAAMPRLPDIEADRSKWDIVTCPMKRGDLLIFHCSALHGGGPTAVGSQRRSLSLRLVGDDVIRVDRPVVDENSPAANNIADEEDALVARLAKLPLGAPIHTGGLTRLA